MTVSASGGSDQTSLVRQLLASLQSTSASAAPSLGDGGSADPAGSAQGAGPPPGPPPLRPDGAGSNRFSADTLSSLLQAQEQPSASDVASRLIGDTDTDGSGGLSLDEITDALSGASSDGAAASASSLKDAFAKLDANGDGQLSRDELTTGLQTTAGSQRAHHGHHHHGGGAPASTGQAPGADATATPDATAAMDVTA